VSGLGSELETVGYPGTRPFLVRQAPNNSCSNPSSLYSQIYVKMRTASIFALICTLLSAAAFGSFEIVSYFSII
jgi:hypothetical protein